MAIYITGDTHADFTRFSVDSFYEQKEMTNPDENFVIICGDFGGVWDREESKREKWWLKWLDDKPFTILFVDGNHEGFDSLYTYPVKEWHGGLVHEIRPHVLHLMRGQVFTIEDKKFFTFGGASSHDIQDGILDMNDPDWKQKAKDLDDQYKYMYRVKGLTWWEQELPTQEEMQIGRDNLSRHNNMVDFIISHSPSTSELYLMGGKGLYEPDVISNYLEEVKATTEYKRHFFGHMHISKAINDKDICLYEQIIRIN